MKELIDRLIKPAPPLSLPIVGGRLSLKSFAPSLFASPGSKLWRTESKDC